MLSKARLALSRAIARPFTYDWAGYAYAEYERPKLPERSLRGQMSVLRNAFARTNADPQVFADAQKLTHDLIEAEFYPEALQFLHVLADREGDRKSVQDFIALTIPKLVISPVVDHSAQALSLIELSLKTQKLLDTEKLLTRIMDQISSEKRHSNHDRLIEALVFGQQRGLAANAILHTRHYKDDADNTIEIASFSKVGKDGRDTHDVFACVLKLMGQPPTIFFFDRPSMQAPSPQAYVLRSHIGDEHHIKRWKRMDAFQQLSEMIRQNSRRDGSLFIVGVHRLCRQHVGRAQRLHRESLGLSQPIRIRPR